MLSEYMMADDEPYSRRFMKQKLKDHYGDVIFTENMRTGTLVTLQNKMRLIIDKFDKGTRSSSPDDEKNRIIQTAARLIRKDIKLMPNVYFKTEYPHVNTMDVEHAENLKYMMGLLIPGKEQSKKNISIAHALMQASFPRKLMMPLQLGLPVHLHDQFPSRYLIDFLYSMRFLIDFLLVWDFW